VVVLESAADEEVAAEERNEDDGDEDGVIVGDEEIVGAGIGTSWMEGFACDVEILDISDELSL
jgi:hypothetical protein